MHHLVGMAEIAEMLGVTRQRVAQLIETYEDFPKPEVEISGGRVWSRTAIETWIASHPDREAGRPQEGKSRRKFFGGGFGSLFSRFTDRARRSLVLAQEEARLLNHDYIGTEHLVLGLVHEGEGVAARVLAGLHVTLDEVRREITSMIGLGHEKPSGHIPFTPRAKKVLELSLREALQLGHNYIGTEHVLLAVVREKDGVGWKALEKLGLNQKATRAAIVEALRGHGTLAEQTEDNPACSFCGKNREQVRKLVAGPGVYICDECVTLSERIVNEEIPGAEPIEPDDQEGRLAALERAVAELTKELRKRDD